MLFWDRGGKFDDPQWQNLKPVDEETERLFVLVSERFRQLVDESVEFQRRSDLTLLSQFLTSLLFTGVSGAVRCNENGDADPRCDFFKGVELRCIDSVEDFAIQAPMQDVRFAGTLKLESYSRFMLVGRK